MAKDIVDYQMEAAKLRMELKEKNKALAKAEARSNQLEQVLKVFSGEVVPGFTSPRTLVDVRDLASKELRHAYV